MSLRPAHQQNNRGNRETMERIWLRQYEPGIPAEIELSECGSIVDLLDRASDAHPERTALSCMGSELSYAELDRLSRAFASYLHNIEELGAGERVAIMLPNLLHYPIALFGALRAGLAVVNLNPNYTEREVAFHLNDSGARVLIASDQSLGAVPVTNGVSHCKVIVASALEMPAFRELAADPETAIADAKPDGEPSLGISFTRALAQGLRSRYEDQTILPDSVAFLQYTGGTTGNQKAALLSHRNMVANVQQITHWIKANFDANDRCLVSILPIYHIMGLNGNCLFAVAQAWKNVLVPNARDLSHFVDEFRRHRFSFLVGVNALFNALLDHEAFNALDFSCLKLTCGAGAAVQPSVARRWFELTGCHLTGAYGLTEASPAVCYTPRHITDRVGSVGVPLPSTDVILVDANDNPVPPGTPGEITVKGPQVMSGYWNRPDETRNVFTKTGYLRTGDIATIDADGFVTIVDRKKDVVLVSGFNVYPNEVEAVISSHSGVGECACVGVPDERTGEALKVFVVARDRSLTGEILQQYCREFLTGYKVPRQFEFRDTLPKSTVGKILRRALR
jgi:long-chain acyl-CoA synthetase